MYKRWPIDNGDKDWLLQRVAEMRDEADDCDDTVQGRNEASQLRLLAGAIEVACKKWDDNAQPTLAYLNFCADSIQDHLNGLEELVNGWNFGEIMDDRGQTPNEAYMFREAFISLQYTINEAEKK